MPLKKISKPSNIALPTTNAEREAYFAQIADSSQFSGGYIRPDDKYTLQDWSRNNFTDASTWQPGQPFRFIVHCLSLSTLESGKLAVLLF